MLILVLRAVRRDARLAVRAAPLLGGEGRQHRRGHAAHQPPERRAARRARAEGIRRRPAARSRSTFRCRSCRPRVASSPSSPSRPVVAYCDIGRRSRMAAGALAKAGFKEIYSLHGGIAAWKKDGLPVEK